MPDNPNTSFLIGIDLGTSSVKAVLIDQLGKMLDWTDKEYGISSPYPDWAEQDPEIWVDATIEVVRQLLQKSKIDVKRVVGIGLAGQMHGLVCIDGTGKILRPAIIWADRRSQVQLNQLQQQI